MLKDRPAFQPIWREPLQQIFWHDAKNRGAAEVRALPLKIANAKAIYFSRAALVAAVASTSQGFMISGRLRERFGFHSH